MSSTYTEFCLYFKASVLISQLQQAIGCSHSAFGKLTSRRKAQYSEIPPPPQINDDPVIAS